MATKISNVAKRAGTSATVFGATDIVAGGPYNTVSDAFSDDPLMFDESLGYDYEDTTGLSGKELAIANFKNRLRFGADGAITVVCFISWTATMGSYKVWCYQTSDRINKRPITWAMS